MTDEEFEARLNDLAAEIARERKALLTPRVPLHRMIAEEIRYQETLSERDDLSEGHRGYIAGRAEGLRWVYGLIENP